MDWARMRATMSIRIPEVSQNTVPLMSATTAAALSSTASSRSPTSAALLRSISCGRVTTTGGPPLSLVMH
ncbi:MAG TPA: hypothetical protein VGD91_18035, partial [Trebonia sp.]